VRLGRDYYVRLDASDYSVDPAVIGRLVDITAGLDRVRVRVGGHLVAGHARVWARGLTVTDPAHAATARRLRQEFRQPRPSGLPSDLVRDLADYDRAFGPPRCSATRKPPSRGCGLAGPQPLAAPCSRRQATPRRAGGQQTPNFPPP
jgi:hypothetical protein